MVRTQNKDVINKQAEILAGLGKLRSELAAKKGVGISYLDIINALDQFSECLRYLNTRRSTGTKIDIDSEASLQDLIYLMLRPWIYDIIPETPNEKTGNRYSIKDFFVKSAKAVIEVKFIRDNNHGKGISRELHDDIESYRHNPDCEHLIFFIYDPDSNIPDVAALRRVIEEERLYSGRALYCHLIVP